LSQHCEVWFGLLLWVISNHCNYLSQICVLVSMIIS